MADLIVGVGIVKVEIIMSTSSISIDAKPSNGIGQAPVAQNSRQQQKEESAGDYKLCPTHKRNNSLNTCSLSSGVDDIGSCTDHEDQPPSVCESQHDEYEEPQTPQGVERILSVDMFSRFATAYTYPIDGEYDDEYSSDDDDEEEAYCDYEANGIGKERISPDYDNELKETKSHNRSRDRCNNNAWSQQSGYLDGEKFIENEDADDNDGGESTALPHHYRRGHRRVNSLPWTKNETKDVSTPLAVDKEPVTPLPPKLTKKRAPAMLRNQRRSLSMSNTDLNGRYGGGGAPPSGAMTPPRVPSLNASVAAGGIPHRRIVSAHSPLSDMLEITSLSASPKPPRPTSLSGGTSPRLRSRAGLPPRPSGHPITLSPQLSWSQPERTSSDPHHKRSHSAPMMPSPRSTSNSACTAAPQNSGGPTAHHHFRSFSYGSFKALHGVSESLYLSQAPLDTSPDPSLLGSRPRHHTRSHSLDSRSTAMSTKSRDSTVSEPSQADLDAEQTWNDYYDQKLVQKNFVKDELKYRLSKAMPKVFVKSLSLSSRPALKRADSAKFV